jgi:hypothetical protein
MMKLQHRIYGLDCVLQESVDSDVIGIYMDMCEVKSAEEE